MKQMFSENEILKMIKEKAIPEFVITIDTLPDIADLSEDIEYNISEGDNEWNEFLQVIKHNLFLITFTDGNHKVSFSITPFRSTPNNIETITIVWVRWGAYSVGGYMLSMIYEEDSVNFKIQSAEAQF